MQTNNQLNFDEYRDTSHKLVYGVWHHQEQDFSENMIEIALDSFHGRWLHIFLREIIEAIEVPF